MVHVAAMRRPSASASRSGQPMPVRSTKPVVAGCGSLISQVPPAMIVSPGEPEVVAGARRPERAHGGDVHVSLRSVSRPVRGVGCADRIESE
jgi:hypothetical protein